MFCTLCVNYISYLILIFTEEVENDILMSISTIKYAEIVNSQGFVLPMKVCILLKKVYLEQN